MGTLSKLRYNIAALCVNLCRILAQLVDPRNMQPVINSPYTFERCSLAPTWQSTPVIIQDAMHRIIGWDHRATLSLSRGSTVSLTRPRALGRAFDRDFDSSGPQLTLSRSVPMLVASLEVPPVFEPRPLRAD